MARKKRPKGRNWFSVAAKARTGAGAMGRRKGPRERSGTELPVCESCGAALDPDDDAALCAECGAAVPEEEDEKNKDRFP